MTRQKWGIIASPHDVWIEGLGRLWRVLHNTGGVLGFGLHDPAHLDLPVVGRDDVADRLRITEARAREHGASHKRGCRRDDDR